jgi:6-pyruvoyltetrahydropterin/6-carboxytetrahydropterin synthase
VTLTRRYRFSASHRLHSPMLSVEANEQVYGRCNNPFGHGHNYVLEVSVSGPVDPRTGRVVALSDLDALVHKHVLAIYDGSYMNVDIDTFQGDVVPTTENVAVDIRRRLEAQWPPHGPAWLHTANPPRLTGVRLYETRKNIFDN